MVGWSVCNALTFRAPINNKKYATTKFRTTDPRILSTVAYPLGHRGNVLHGNLTTINSARLLARLQPRVMLGWRCCSRLKKNRHWAMRKHSTFSHFVLFLRFHCPLRGIRASLLFAALIVYFVLFLIFFVMLDEMSHNLAVKLILYGRQHSTKRSSFRQCHASLIKCMF